MKSLYSRHVIAGHFRQTADLTTIQLAETILCEPGSVDRGAALFCERIRYLLNHVPAGYQPTFIWLVRDTDQLRHVVKEVKAADVKLYTRLAAHAIYGEAAASNPFYQAVDQAPAKAVGTDHPTLTASLVADSKEGDHYAYYGHFSPDTKGDGWENGPYCEELQKTPKALNQLVVDLHLAHAEIINQKGSSPGRAMKRLQKEGISMLSLSNLVK